MNGIAFFRFNRLYGWMLTAWIPTTKEYLRPHIAAYHHSTRGHKVMVITGQFNQLPKKGRFCRQPHKLMAWPSQALEKLAA